jgi:hypothetical protein
VTRVTINTANTDADVLTLQVSSSNGSIASWGTADSAGVFHDDWFIRYSVSGGTLTRSILNTASVVQSTQTVAVHVDLRFGSVKGFAVTRTNSLFNVTVRLNKPMGDGAFYRKTLGSTVLVKNN